jgi:hypothetical protein
MIPASNSKNTTDSGRKFDFHQYRRREPAKLSSFLRMLVYAIIVSGIAFGLLEMLSTLSKYS